MNQFRLLFTFAAALVVALGASYFVYNKLAMTPAADASTRQVVVAAHDLPIGVPLTPPDLKTVRWSGDAEPPGSVSSPDDVIGRPLIYPVFNGEPLLLSKLAPEGSGAGLGAVITEGMRAVSIRVDEVVAVAGFVIAGSRVDVMLTGMPSQSGSEQVTQTILEDVQVLAAGQKIQPDADGKPERVNVVTLLCSPEDSARVVLAASEGRIQLILRNPSDKPTSEDNKGGPMVNRRELYANAMPPSKPAPRPAVRTSAPAPAPVVVAPPEPTSAPVMMIRGSSVSQIDVPLQ